MSTDSPLRSATDWDQRESPWASGLTVFAGSMMMVVGVWQALAGIAALVNDDLYVATPNYIYAFDLTGWGWIHLLLGLLVAGAGFGVLRGQMWARIIGIVAASLSLIANFLFIPHYPIWSLLIIALDVAVIWALVTHSRDVA
jgi:hypothetical protein